MRKLLMVGTCLGTLVACADVDSEDILTSGMFANLSVTADGSGDSEALATLRVGGAGSTTYVELSEGDDLTASAGDGEGVAMEEYELLDYHGYKAVLPTDDPETEFNISLTRTVDEGAPNSTISIPAPFDIEDVPDSLDRSLDLPLNWSEVDPSLTLTVATSGTCVEAYSDEIDNPEDGTVDVPALVPLEGEEDTSCEVTVTLRLRETGTIDSGYGGGEAFGYQVRSVTFLSTPAAAVEN